MLKKRKIDSNGLLMCKIQAQAFEHSIDRMECSSDVFVRRFMHSKIADLFDNEGILDTNYQWKDVLDFVEEEYGVSNYGSVKYSPNEMYWIGYVYRYYSYTYEMSSAQVYRIVKPKELRDVYLPYHTLDPSQAIERILEAKGLPLTEEEELKRQYEIIKRIYNDDK